jgi:hypothetical protein
MFRFPAFRGLFDPDKPRNREMRTITGGRRRLVTFLILALLAPLAAGIASRPLVVAGGQESVALYESDQFDYFFFYDAALWEIEEETSRPGRDLVRLTTEEVVLQFLAFAAPGVTVEDCLQTLVAELARDPSVLAIEDLTREGEPVRAGMWAEDLAVAMFFLTVDEGEGPRDLAVSHRCEEIDPGRSLLYTTLTVPAEPYARAELWKPLEEHKFPTIAGYPRRAGVFPQFGPVTVRNASGALMGTFISNHECVERDFLVMARASRDGDTFVIDPSAFTVVFESGEPAPVEVDAWLYPRIDTDKTLMLGPDEIALFRFAIEGHHYDLYYTPPAGEQILIGDNRDEYCGGGGSGAPILIDLE